MRIDLWARGLVKAAIVTMTMTVAMLTSNTAWGLQLVPDCMADGKLLAMNNAEVLNWKATTPNQFHARAHIQGTLTKIYPDQTGHKHLQVKIGMGSTDTIEVIYSEDFGDVGPISIGMDVEACGDYITASKPKGGPVSPDLAIVHWVHRSNNASHASGYMAIDGVVYGADEDNGKGHQSGKGGKGGKGQRNGGRKD